MLIMNRKNDEILCNKYIHILHEIHIKENCSCSYCRGDNKLHYGLNVPKDKS